METEEYTLKELECLLLEVKLGDVRQISYDKALFCLLKEIKELKITIELLENDML